jgi:DNA-binding NtrC family response regulator
MQELLKLVIIDDNPSSLELLSSALENRGISIYTADEPHKGIALVREVRPQLVITDLVMPGMTGLDVLNEIMSFAPRTEVILMTAHYSSETAVDAIRKGAADYWQKPVKIAKLRERVSELLEVLEKRRGISSSSIDPANIEFEGMLAKSDSMWKLFQSIDKVAPHFRTLLIQGPTGAGKDLVAKALHHRSRAKGQFVVLNCSAVVETLFESELFGHTRGAFTGADRDKIGLFVAADNGTLFLDEIGDMPMAAQAKLLRAIQNQEVHPVGSLAPKRVNVKVIAATHKDLKAAVKDGQFREDLYYRISMVELYVPPLAQRLDDIDILANYFLRRFSVSFHKEARSITPRALLVLRRYNWPGNVRQLEHVIGRACMLTDGNEIDLEDLPAEIVDGGRDEPAASSGSLLDNQEKEMIERALRETRGNQSETARRLGIGRDALRYKLKKHNVRFD